MKKIILLALVHLLCFVSSGSSATLDIEWPDLVPEIELEEGSLENLSEEERGFVEWIIYLRNYLPEVIKPINQEFHEEMDKAIPELKAKGIDVDKILAARKRRSVAVNRELDGKMVKLAGYLLPLDLSGNKVKEFLLVPTIGACIHTPPPPPNQIVFAISPEAIEYELEKLFMPVYIIGKLEIKSLSKNLFLVDGSADINVGYRMNVDKIEKYKAK